MCNVLGPLYVSLGCFKDTAERAIPILEKTDKILDGHYRTRENAIEKCLQIALNRGFNTFAVQHGGACFGSSTARNTYNKYGSSSKCASDGKGGPLANEVYAIRGNHARVI